VGIEHLPWQFATFPARSSATNTMLTTFHRMKGKDTNKHSGVQPLQIVVLSLLVISVASSWNGWSLLGALGIGAVLLGTAHHVLKRRWQQSTWMGGQRMLTSV